MQLSLLRLIFTFLICILLGMVLSPQAQRRFRGAAKINFEEPLDMLDLIDMGDRVRHMDIVSFSQG